MSYELRERASDDLLFATLRTLMTARVLWGVRAAVHLPDLCSLLAISESRLQLVLHPLFQDGWLTRDELGDTVRLTWRGVRYFMASQA